MKPYSLLLLFSFLGDLLVAATPDTTRVNLDAKTGETSFKSDFYITEQERSEILGRIYFQGPIGNIEGSGVQVDSTLIEQLTVRQREIDSIIKELQRKYQKSIAYKKSDPVATSTLKKPIQSPVVASKLVMFEDKLPTHLLSKIEDNFRLGEYSAALESLYQIKPAIETMRGSADINPYQLQFIRRFDEIVRLNFKDGILIKSMEVGFSFTNPKKSPIGAILRSLTNYCLSDPSCNGENGLSLLILLEHFHPEILETSYQQIYQAMKTNQYERIENQIDKKKIIGDFAGSKNDIELLIKQMTEVIIKTHDIKSEPLKTTLHSTLVRIAQS